MMSYAPVKRQKIAVLGGGMAALTAVFELTNQPDWQNHYEITVYQMGWRLGGKGASGRNLDANARIEEHGLHIFMGSYENTFQMMRHCYAELGRKAGTPLATWQDAFKPYNVVSLPEQVDNQWKLWINDLPVNNLLPGDGVPFPSVWGYVQTLVDYLVRQVQETLAALTAFWQDVPPENESQVSLQFPDWIQTLRQDMGLTVTHQRESAIAKLYLAQQIIQALPKDPQQHQKVQHQAIIWLLQNFCRWFGDFLGDLVKDNDKFRRYWVLAELSCIIACGLIQERVIFRGFDCLDDYDFREWLQRQGASNLTVNSAPVRGFYDLAFAYEDGDTERPNFAAGAFLRCFLRMNLSFRGAIFWKMQSGMGDTIFTPLYELLQQRGVKFQFFHRVKHLELSTDKQSIAAIYLGRQATVKGDTYNPLVDIKGLTCWPSAPLYEQLVEGEALQTKQINLESISTPWGDVEEKFLRVGEDFDVVLLGISIAAIKALGQELIAANPAWESMMENVKTVKTLALQLWLKPNLTQLGWSLQIPVMGGYEHPFNTWADMSHLLPQEDWPVLNSPANIAYFCGPLQENAVATNANAPALLSQETEQVRTTAVAWMEQHLPTLWPNMANKSDHSALNWNLLVDRQNRQGTERLDSQFWKANVEPTDRYVLSLKGSTCYRLQSDRSGFSNLYLTGDWTLNGINVGCIEATVVSGMQAARAIGGYAKTIIGETDF
ncbi:NAD(P)-binding protein [Desmonostoc muscorum LEGE 12446]|uniref:NAD(P)-binding protein n=1 Tax=Desmonostoc muscorum TaxID=1179 RepID=UPI001F379BAB|nr:NAD(P)-binding protein [Desmonostoc muscorum]MCF2151403.1 NAD(P)-binding protein [Desmonostoc muscorum LEGE 12446]